MQHNHSITLSSTSTPQCQLHIIRLKLNVNYDLHISRLKPELEDFKTIVSRNGATFLRKAKAKGVHLCLLKKEEGVHYVY